MPEQLIAADWTFTPGGFVRDLGLTVADGRLTGVAPLGDRQPTRRLAGRALLPGFVNAHSHAFQRGLRGRGERFPAGAGSFWTWREAMYGLVESLDAEGLYDLCHRAFSEMITAGMTAVGEFHYLHHLSPAGTELDFAADAVVLEAARDVGIRLVLLEAFYKTGGFDGRPLEGGQRRFATPSLEVYWRAVDQLEARLGANQSLGLVAHSLRAVPVEDLRRLWRGARERDLVLHLHLEEQRQEIEDCLAVHGKRPLALLCDELFGPEDEHGEDGSRLTAVHCTHSLPSELGRLLGAGAHVCLCPLTEANLGDGMADLPAMLEAGGHVCLGSDSNARLSMLEEMRWLEYAQRLRLEKRGVVVDAEGRAGRRLLEAATLGGSCALGLEAGAIEVGRLADLVALDLGHPSLAGVDAEHLEDALALGMDDGAIDAVCVGGRWLR